MSEALADFVPVQSHKPKLKLGTLYSLRSICVKGTQEAGRGGLGHGSPQQTQERGSGGRYAGHAGLTESGSLTTIFVSI
jgi:hypothetical protein